MDDKLETEIKALEIEVMRDVNAVFKIPELEECHNFLIELAKKPFGSTIKIEDLPKSVLFVESPDSVIFKYLLQKYSLLSYNPVQRDLKISTMLQYNVLHKIK